MTKSYGPHKAFMTKFIFESLVGLLLPLPCHAYIVPSDETLARMSDIIVIAVPLENRETTNTWFLRQGSRDIRAVEVETRFEILAVIKGQIMGNEFVLSHSKWADPGFRRAMAGPSLLTFDVTKKEKYRMFLKRESNRKIIPTLKSDTAYSIT